MGKRGPQVGTKYAKKPLGVAPPRLKAMCPLVVASPVQVARVQRFTDLLTALIMELELRAYPVSQLNPELCQHLLHGLVMLEGICIEGIYLYDAPDPFPDPPFPPGHPNALPPDQAERLRRPYQ